MIEVKIHKCRPRNHIFPIASWAIRLFENTDYSHFAIEFGPLVLDATSSDVRFSSKRKFLHKYEVVGTYKLSVSESLEGLLYWASTHLNKSYGYAQIFGLALIVLGVIKKNPFGKDSDILVCNELVILFLRDFGFLDERYIYEQDSFGLRDTESFIQLSGITEETSHG